MQDTEGHLVKESILMTNEYFNFYDEQPSPTFNQTEEPKLRTLNSEKYFVLVNKERRAIQAGDQVHNTYGNRPNKFLML